MSGKESGKVALQPPVADPLRRYPSLNGWIVALIMSLLAGLARWALDPYLANRVPFATFFIAIVIVVRYGGVWTALLTMLIGLVWSLLAWSPDGFGSTETIAASIVYVLSSLAIILLGRQMHQAEARAETHAAELQQTVHGLRASQGRLQLATQMSELGVFEWDIVNDSFTGENPEAYRIFGRTPDMPKLAMAEFIAIHMHPEDVLRLQTLLDHSMRPGERFQAVFRMRRKDEEWRWVEIAGRFFFSDAAKPTHLIGVVADVTERKNLEDNLRKMAMDLSEDDRRKDEFLATLAHELRNPLAPIRNGIEVLKRSQPGAQSASVIGVMERQMAHMVRLVDDLIDVSRITRNRLELRRERVELGQVIAAAVESSRPLIEARGHQLTVSPLPVPVHLDADPTRLVQVFTNLLNNAAKYTDRGGRVAIIAERQGDDICVRVMDNGIGIAKEKQQVVFDMFIQLDRSPERAQGGLGIGLSMVKRLVELHDGNVDIHSDGVGLGTTVTVRIPVVLSPGSNPGAADPGKRVIDVRRRILVVDDNEDAAQSLASVLTLMGNEVAIGNDGVEAVQLADVFLPDVIMLDLGMPRMNGYEACRQIREQAQNADTVIIAVTGWGQDEDRRRSEMAGFNLHLTKPVDLAAVEAILSTLPLPRGTS